MLEFGVEVEELPDADLVVGADGANSFVRRLRDFGTKVRPEGSKYVWFGTDHVFDAFTFAFRETEHGLFNAHAYPYDERMSTFIVECPEPVWRAAGLDELDEQESLAFCEQLFANELRGRELFSNRSLWLDFPKITNRTWHVGNVVILGDAAHTAHFSIGSGTKLAMEDSISLAAALAQAALGPGGGVRRLRAGARAVRRAHAGRRERERRVLRADRELLAPRADPVRLQPDHAERADHARDARGARPAVHARARRLAGRSRAVSPPPAFSPFELRGVRFENRFELVESTVAVSPEGRVSVGGRRRSRGQAPASPEPCRPTRRDAAAEPWASTCRSRDGWPVVAPTRRPYGPFGAVPGEPDEDGVLEAFVAAASSARAEVLEIDMAHGYLLGSYLSPLTNDEDDRLRFPVSVLEAVRAVWGGPLAVRLSVTDWHPRGNTVDDGIEIARALAEHGCDLIHVEAGQTIHDDRPQYRRGYLTALSDRVRNGARVPTLVGGYLTTLDEANTIVGAGRADLVLLDLPDTQIERTLESS